MIQTKIAATPGLKKVAQHLLLSSLDKRRIVISVSDSGRDSLQYILSQQGRIEQLLSKEFGMKFQVIIEAPAGSTSNGKASRLIDEVKDNELVQAARGLFDGTIVQVKNVEEKQE